ncbi:hypothetical protein NKG05_20855 [Oerskovia sp. M15]
MPGGFSFAADTEVPVVVYNRSQEWQEREFVAVSQFTHVLFEAERPIFGRLFSRDVSAEAEQLASRASRRRSCAMGPTSVCRAGTST